MAPIMYYSKSGDTVRGVAGRFNVAPAEITSNGPLPEKAMIDPGTLLFIPNRISQAMSPSEEIMPDTEVILGTTSVGFDSDAYIKDANGYLAHPYTEYLGSTGWIKGPEAIKRLAFENSINPRLLLAILEYESRWVRGQPVEIPEDTLGRCFAPIKTRYPIRQPFAKRVIETLRRTWTTRIRSGRPRALGGPASTGRGIVTLLRPRGAVPSLCS